MVESCADPSIIHGQTWRQYWYMYCTTDPLNGTIAMSRDTSIFHLIPMLRSLDLVNWTYVGDAFSARPAWVPPTRACGRRILISSMASTISTTPRPTPACPAAAARSASPPPPARPARGPTAARRQSSRTTRPAARSTPLGLRPRGDRRRQRPEVYLLRQLLRRHLGAQALGRRAALRPGQPGADHYRQPLRGRRISSSTTATTTCSPRPPTAATAR